MGGVYFSVFSLITASLAAFVCFSGHCWSGSFCMLQCVSVVTVALSAFVCQWSLLVCLLCVSVIIAGLSVFIGVSGLCWLSELCVSVVTVGLICVFQSVLLVCLLCVFQWLLVVRLQHVLSLHALLTRALLNFEGTLYKLFQKLSLMYAYFVFSLCWDKAWHGEWCTCEKMCFIPWWWQHVYSMFLCSRDYTEFLEELEEDPEMRKNVNIFKGNGACVLSSIYRSKMSHHWKNSITWKGGGGTCIYVCAWKGEKERARERLCPLHPLQPMLCWFFILDL